MVIAGLDPAIHEALQQNANVRCAVLHFIMDARDKPAHDAVMKHCLPTVMSRPVPGMTGEIDPTPSFA